MLAHTASTRTTCGSFCTIHAKLCEFLSQPHTERMWGPIVEWTTEWRQIIYYAPKILFILWMALWFLVVIEKAATAMPSVRANRSLRIRNVAIPNRIVCLQTNLDILLMKNLMVFHLFHFESHFLPFSLVRCSFYCRGLINCWWLTLQAKWR